MKYEADLMDARREGIREGESKGILKGRREGYLESSLEFTKNLLQRGFPKKDIMEIARCTEEIFLQAQRELELPPKVSMVEFVDSLFPDNW